MVGKTGSEPIADAESRILNWLFAFGIFLIVAGLFAILFPFMATVVTKIFLGWLLLVSGIIQIFYGFSVKDKSKLFLNLLIGGLHIFVGGWLAFYPLAGTISLTLLLALTFIMHGALEIGLSMRSRQDSGWMWMLIAGLVGIAAGSLIIANLPGSAAWAIGLLVGVNMLSSGWAYLITAITIRKKV